MATLRVSLTVVLLLGLGLSGAGCMQDNPVAPEATAEFSAAELRPDHLSPRARANEHACWGQASKVFAQMGEMGAHASQQATPRLGLRNVARALYEQGVLPDDSMQSLGAFLAGALGLSIDTCL